MTCLLLRNAEILSPKMFFFFPQNAFKVFFSNDFYCYKDLRLGPVKFGL